MNSCPWTMRTCVFFPLQDIYKRKRHRLEDNVPVDNDAVDPIEEERNHDLSLVNPRSTLPSDKYRFKIANARLRYSISFPWIFFDMELLQMKKWCEIFRRRVDLCWFRKLFKDQKFIQLFFRCQYLCLKVPILWSIDQCMRINSQYVIRNKAEQFNA